MGEDATYDTGGVLDGLGLRPEKPAEFQEFKTAEEFLDAYNAAAFAQLERAVIEAAITLKESDYDGFASETNIAEWCTFDSAVDALLKARQT